MDGPVGLPGSEGLKVILIFHFCWTNVSVSLLTHHVFHATLCLIQRLVKGKRGEKGPRGKQGSPVSDCQPLYATVY